MVSYEALWCTALLINLAFRLKVNDVIDLKPGCASGFDIQVAKQLYHRDTFVLWGADCRSRYCILSHWSASSTSAVTFTYTPRFRSAVSMNRSDKRCLPVPTKHMLKSNMCFSARYLQSSNRSRMDRFPSTFLTSRRMPKHSCSKHIVRILSNNSFAFSILKVPPIAAYRYAGLFSVWRI